MSLGTRPALSSTPIRRLVSVNMGVLLIVIAIVIAVYNALPVIPAWVYPVVFTAVGFALLGFAQRARRAGSALAARIWAGWAGFLALLLVLAWSNLLGWGGALSTTLLVAITVNVLIAGVFRSAVHFAIAQAGTLVWAAIAFLYEIPVVPLLVVAAAGLWWVGTIAFSAAVVVATTITLPVALALLIHPLTHDGLAIDGGDVATLAGCIAAASLLGSVITRAAPDARIWITQRTTILVVLIVQSLLGSIPAVAAVFRPNDPWSGLLTGLAGILIAAAALAFAPARTGAKRVVAYSGLLWLSVAGSVVLPVTAAALIVPVILFIVVARRSWHADPRSLGSIRNTAGMAGLVIFITLVSGLPPYVSALVIAASGLTVVALTMRPRPVPPRGRVDDLEAAA